MIGSCLGLTAANCILLNQTDLRPVFDIMSSAANNSRLDDFGVDAFHLNKSLSRCITKGFTDPRTQRKYSAQEMIVRSGANPNRVEQAKQIMADMDANEPKGYIFSVSFDLEESYILLWLIYTLNFNIWPKNILAQDEVDLPHPDSSILVNLLSSIPSYSVTGQRLFGMELYRLIRKNDQEFKNMIKAHLMRPSGVKKKITKLTYSMLKVRMNGMKSEIAKWEEMVRADGSANHDNIEEELAQLRVQLAGMDSGETVLGQLQSDNLIKSYCKVFGKDYETTKDLVRNMDKEKLLAVYDDMKDVVWGLNDCNVDFYDDCRRSITITYGKYNTVEGLSNFSGVIAEVKEAIDSASSLFEPIRRSV